MTEHAALGPLRPAAHDLAIEITAVEVSHPDVRHDHVEWFYLQPRERPARGADRGHAVPGSAQDLGQGFADFVLIVDDEDRATATGGERAIGDRHFKLAPGRVVGRKGDGEAAHRRPPDCRASGCRRAPPRCRG